MCSYFMRELINKAWDINKLHHRTELIKNPKDVNECSQELSLSHKWTSFYIIFHASHKCDARTTPRFLWLGQKTFKIRKSRSCHASSINLDTYATIKWFHGPFAYIKLPTFTNKSMSLRTKSIMRDLIFPQFWGIPPICSKSKCSHLNTSHQTFGWIHFQFHIITTLSKYATKKTWKTITLRVNVEILDWIKDQIIRCLQHVLWQWQNLTKVCNLCTILLSRFFFESLFLFSNF